MAQLRVRNLEDDVKVRLRRRVRRHGRRDEDAKAPLGSRLRARFAGVGLEDELPELRGEVVRPAALEE